MAAQADTAPTERQDGQAWWLWPVVALVVLAVCLAYLTAFDFLTLGDGAVGVDSDSLRTATVQESPSDVGIAYVGRDPAGSMTIGFPLTNRGFVPVTVVELQPAPGEPAGLDPACLWRRTAVHSRREDPVVPGGVVQPFSARVPAGATVQLYVGAGFLPADCPTEPGIYSSVANMVVEYEVLGVWRRRQHIPMAFTVTTAFDPDDPALERGEN